jgi:hypothetical protein
MKFPACIFQKRFDLALVVSLQKLTNSQNVNLFILLFKSDLYARGVTFYPNETTPGERESGRNDSGRPGIGAKRLTGGMECRSNFGHVVIITIFNFLLISLYYFFAV